MPRVMWVVLVSLLLSMSIRASFAETPREYALAAGDIVRVSVYQNPDLNIAARVAENGNISFPLIGSVKIGGLAVSEAEALIAKKLEQGGFVRQPQVTILLQEIRGNQVSVLGQVNRPGRYPLDTTNIRVTDALALAGGISATGADVVVVTGARAGKPFRYELDIPALYQSADEGKDMLLAAGDTLYVDRAPVFYIYGEVQHPGVFRLGRGMTLMQAIAAGGGVTQRGTLKGVQVNRRDAKGKLVASEPGMDTALSPDDVVYVRESLF